MNDQRSNKSSKEIFDLIEKINKQELGDDIEELKDLLNKVTKKIEEKGSIPTIKIYDISIGLHRDGNKNFNKPMGKGYNKSVYYYHITDYFYNNNEYYYLTEEFYNKIRYNYLIADFHSGDEVISCDLDYLIGKIKCNSHNGKLFRLSDPFQKCTFLEDIKKKILDILYYDILYPGELTNIGNRYKNMIAYVSMNLKNRTKEDPKISIYRSTYNNEFRFEYDEGIFKIEITLL
jgi:hypothetical protein